jgi:hypothetical protein
MIGWAYSTTSLMPLPDILPPIQTPLAHFAPFNLEHLSQNKLARLLRSISVHTNVLEGVLDFNAGEMETLIALGFASSNFSHSSDSSMSERYSRQVLLDSLAATELSLNRVGLANAKFDEAFIRDVHRLFTKTACVSTYRVRGQTGSAYIARGAYKFLSNHVLARNGKYHIYCPPKDVPGEIEKILAMIEVCSHFVFNYTF